MSVPAKSKIGGLANIFSEIRFRNSESVGPVIIQCFMIMAACLVIAGLIYVGIVMITIIIHHSFWDREPRNVPTYVKRALQFDSDTDSEDDQSMPSKARKKEDNIIEIVDDTGGNYDEVSDFSSHKARKMGNMDKFLGKDIDVSR